MKASSELNDGRKVTCDRHGQCHGANDLLEYWVDASQRSILLLDTLRQRGNNCLEHNARKAPNVLSFAVELVLDGRSLPRPVNYGLVRIIPPKAPRSTRVSGRSLFLTRAPGMAPVSAA